MKPRFYYTQIGDLQQRLLRFVQTEDLRELHRLQPARHLLTVGRHTLLYVVCAVALFSIDNPWIWVPLTALQGTVILGFVILLHEQVHDTIFRPEHPRLMRFLGLAYAVPSAISASQFHIWHNDHHRELGSDVTDPKRAHLSPKLNRRWYKLLYMTPALFIIYARAAGREAKTYSPELRRRIRRERLGNVLVHLLFVAGLATAGWDVVLRVYAFPHLVFFPPVFIINRIGQHYAIQPGNVAGWSTLVNGNPLIRFLFLNSNHHIEHHYYPAVPFYNLPRLNRLLQPFFASEGIKNRSYRNLLHGWFIRNREAHTEW